jgi:cbb3-type cytochrome oxidase subunit 3
VNLSDAMSAAGLSGWAELALILSFIAFAGIVVWVFVIRRRRSYEHARRLPLENGADGGQRDGGGKERQ